MDAMDYINIITVGIALALVGIGIVFWIVVTCCQTRGYIDDPDREQQRTTESHLPNNGTFTYNTETETVNITWKISRKQ